MAVQRKNIVAIVSNSAGYLATWPSFNFKGFVKELDGGLGDCTLDLPLAFDYGGNDLAVGNEVEIRISDKDTEAVTGGDPVVAYRGYISLIERYVEEAREGVTVTLLGWYTLLATDILKDSQQTTLYSYTSGGLTTNSAFQGAADIGKMMRTVIDRYRAETTNPRISYVTDDIPNTGTTVTYRFQQQTYREAMDALKKMAPSGTYYYVDEQGRVKMKPKPTTPTHKFIFGRHFSQVQVQTSLEKVRNFLLVWNGETGGPQVYKHYQNDVSIAQYGRRAEAANDYSVDNSNAADAIGAKFLAEGQDPDVRVTCTILDNNESDSFGYDIESIQPGDTCSFYGFNSSLADIFRDNMLITRVEYQIDRVVLEVEVVKSGLLQFQEDQDKKLSQISTGGFKVPESYT